MTDAEMIAEARKLLEGTTSGPWTAETLMGNDANGDEWPTDVEITSQSGRHIHGHDLGYNDDVDAEIIANARFIAASRELVPALLDALEAARAERAKAVDRAIATLAEITSGVATTPYGLEGDTP